MCWSDKNSTLNGGDVIVADSLGQSHPGFFMLPYCHANSQCHWRPQELSPILCLLFARNEEVLKYRQLQGVLG